MRVLIHSNSPWSGSGYGVQTKLFAPRLHDAGHPTAVSAFYGLQGGILDWRGLKIYPAGHQPYGTDIVAAHAQHFGADAVIALMDAWVMGQAVTECKTLGVPLMFWAPVDQSPVPGNVAQVARESAAFLCYSKWGTEEALKAGVEQAVYMPLAVDTSVYRPEGRAEARRVLGLPEDAYVVGMVAANKCPYQRKAWAQALEGFAMFAESHPDAVLYLHTEPTPAHGGWDIYGMVTDNGLEGRVHFSDRYLFHLGFSDDQMRNVFNSFDVLLSPSQSEGFGVPIIEAQACGVPVIIGDWTSMPELFGVGHVIQKEDALRTRTLQGGYWYLPQPAAITDALNEVYRNQVPAWGKVARAMAMHFDADEVTRKHLLPFLEKFNVALREETEPRPIQVTSTGTGPRVSVIIPTVRGREASLERCLEAYRRTTTGHELELVVVPDRPSCGEAWNDGVRMATGEYLHITADDIEPHDGWLDAALACIEAGAIPSAYLDLPGGGTDGAVLPDGEPAAMTPLPFVPRDAWPGVKDIHYWSDYDVSDRLRDAGWEIRWCHGYRFTHHRVGDAARLRMEARFQRDSQEYRAKAVAA